LWIGLVLLLMILTLLAGLGSPSFTDSRNMENIFQSWLISALLVLPMILVVVSGGLDLSVGAVIGLSTVMAASMMEAADASGAAALVTVLGLAFGVGLVNGLVTGLTRLHGAVVTLGMMTLLRGIAFGVNEGAPILVQDVEFFSVLTVPAVILLILLVIIVFVLAEFTRFGRKRYTDSLTEESWLVRLVRTAIPYILSSVMAGLAGLLLIARLRTGMAATGTGYEAETILAVFLGGIPLGGGLVNVIGAMLASLAIALNKNITLLNGMSPFATQIRLGLGLLIFGVFSQVYSLAADWIYQRRKS
jgi:ribose transport system permease protein